jgi:WD40 repeat protein
MKLFLIACLLLLLATSVTAQTDPSALVARLASPDHRVQAVAFSPDGKLIAAGYGFFDDGGITIWNISDGSVEATVELNKADKAGIRRVAFSDDGKLLAAATDRGDVLLWNVGAWRLHKTLLKNQGKSTDLSFSADSTKLAYSSDQVAILYDLKTAQTITVTRGDGRGRAFYGISFSPDGKLVVICGNRLVEIWDVESKKIVKNWQTKSFGFFGRVSNDGAHIVGGGGAIFGEKLVEVWNLADGEKAYELSTFRNGLFALAISHSGKLFAVAGGTYGGGEGSLSLWNLVDARELGFTSFGEFPIKGLAFSPDDRLLAAASEDGFVLIYAVDRLRGPQLKKQTSALCGEIMVEGNKPYIVPLSKVPNPMRPNFEFAWRLEIANADAVAGLVNSPVVLRDWSIESNAAMDRARLSDGQSLLLRGHSKSDYVVFGYVQNPGWNEGYMAKIYDDNTFVATDNSGKCRAFGSLSQLKTDFASVKKRLINEGLIGVGRDPLTLGTDHYGTAFIDLTTNGVSEIRSDADDIGVLLKGGPAKKREAFSRIFNQEKPFIDSLLHSGMKLPAN